MILCPFSLSWVNPLFSTPSYNLCPYVRYTSLPLFVHRPSPLAPNALDGRDHAWTHVSLGLGGRQYRGNYSNRPCSGWGGSLRTLHHGGWGAEGSWVQALAISPHQPRCMEHMGPRCNYLGIPTGLVNLPLCPHFHPESPPTLDPTRELRNS